MKYTTLGRLGWQVSRLGIGTVELGVPYGFMSPREAATPDRAEALRLLLSAFAAGINLVDTSPTYGAAEELIGQALREWTGPEILVAGKIPTWGHQIEAAVHDSLRRLGREQIDLLQIYSGSPDLEGVLRSLEVARNLRGQGKVRALGISLYDMSIAEFALETDDLELLQVPFNLLDRRMAHQVLPQAEYRGKAVLGRSALLKGILTPRRNWAPAALGPLIEEVDRIERTQLPSNSTLSQVALSYCLSQATISSVLIGLRNQQELEAALAVLDLEWDLGNLEAYRFPFEAELLDPRKWPEKETRK